MTNKVDASASKTLTLDLSYLSDFNKRQSEGVERDILLPNGKPMGLKIKIVGPDSERAEKAVTEVQKEFAAKSSESGELDENAQSAERQRRFAFASKCSVSMSPEIVTFSGEEFRCNEDDLRKLFEKLFFVGDQVYNQAISRADFMAG
jgi:ornithine carbamoyltransferase